MKSERIIELFGGWQKKESLLGVYKINGGIPQYKNSIEIFLDIKEPEGDEAINKIIDLGPYETEKERDLIFDELINWVSE